MKRYLSLLLAFLILFSCKQANENKSSQKANQEDINSKLQVTVISDLPDSMQPQTIFLDTMPQPVSIEVRNKADGIAQFKGKILKRSTEPPINKLLAVLQDKKGESVLDSAGGPFIMGYGGQSNFTTFSTDNGLALDAISCSVMDKTGNLWFGTLGGGVSRYNGKKFTSFTSAQGLANNTVLCILEDKTGKLWFGTQGGGVSCYDGKIFKTFTSAQGLANNEVFSMVEDNTGNIWFSTLGSGVSRYDGKTFTTFTTDQGLSDNVIFNISKDKAGNLWFGTYGGGVSRYDGKIFTTFTAADGLANNIVFSFAEDKAGNIWFGTLGGGVSRFDGKNFKTFTSAQGLANNNIFSILEDKAGNIWFGTDGGGATLFDGKIFKSFSTAQGLANNIVRSILEDKSGNIWFCTEGGGASRYDGKAFTTFSKIHGLANNAVISILEDKKGDLWFGTYGGGVSCFNEKSFTNYSTAQGLSNGAIFSITEDKNGNLWFGTQGSGVCKYDGKSFTSLSTAQGLANNVVFNITEDRKGNLWIATNGGGVSRFDGQSITTFTTVQGLLNNVIRCVFEDKTGNIWFGTDGGGVCCYNGNSIIAFTTNQGLANNTVLSITEDKSGNLWFGTAEGLSVLTQESLNTIYKNGALLKDGFSSSSIIKSYKIVDGLPDNLVSNVMQLPKGKMALGTNLGITFFNVSKDFTKLEDIEIFNSNTGYPVKDINSGQNCLFLDSKGIIWAGTGSEKTALLRFDYKALNKYNEPPAVLIQSIKIKDENICWVNLQSKGVKNSFEDSAMSLLQEYLAYGKTRTEAENNSILKRFNNIQFDGISNFYPLPQNLVLPYEHNQITFEFAAIETDKPFLVEYQYMLEGYDRNWSPITDKSSANFGNINEGKYTFKLKAKGANGIWSEPVSYTFEVLPPWYRTWWAYLIYVFIFLLALRIFSLWRERSLRAEKEKLEQTVEQRTHEVVLEKKEAVKQREEADKQRKRSDDLLLNILPEEVAEELKAKGTAEAKQFDEVTVLFTDFKDFTQLSEKMTPKELVEEIDTCFKAFDNIMEKYGIEKIKTIGDSYMCAGGLPVVNRTHAHDVVNAALEIKDFILNRLAERVSLGQDSFQIRIGVHTGPVVAGIVGIKKFAYDIWGDTVNTASRMESSGEAGKVNISGTTYELVKNRFTFTHRGKVNAKGKGELDMYFVEGRI